MEELTRAIAIDTSSGLYTYISSLNYSYYLHDVSRQRTEDGIWYESLWSPRKKLADPKSDWARAVSKSPRSSCESFPIHGTDIPDHTEDACVSCHAQLSTTGEANRVPAYGDKK